ncbi:MAG TPA: aspartate--tRNA(Asn) ligase [Patescibacteria group bacterium]|nr:aspartate--tRNA(Asn) ligase [Patescibacteria group bacterium]
MQRTLVNETLKKVGEKVELQGWVNIVRDHGKITFVDLRDRTGLIQCVGTNLPKLSSEDVVEIFGKVVERPEKLINKDLETGKVELQIEEVKILSKAHELPIDMGKDELDVELPTLLDLRSLTLRHKRVQAIFKVQAKIAEGFRQSSSELGCTEIFVPTISASATEGGAEVFRVKYFDYNAYMTQSPQLYKQMLVPVFERVFTIAKAYRAEPSITTRHVTEATQMDCEMAFVTFEELMDALEFVGSSALKYAEKECAKEMKIFKVPALKIPKKIPRLKMREAQEIIFKRTGVDHRKERDLEPEDEREICRWALEEHDSDLVTITHYPTKKRSFYTMPDPKDPEFSLSYDLLFRGVEILSGSQRINDYQQLSDEIKNRGMNPADFEMYLMAFKYGMPPEGGFSFGLERLTMKLLELANVREASLFPRDMERVDMRLSLLQPKEK